MNKFFSCHKKSLLSCKVIKDCFRNTLFKERQRNKDSPYNFSNPPSSITKIDLEEYQKTGTIIKKSNHSDASDNELTSTDEHEDLLSDDHLYELKKLNQQQQQSSRRANRTRFSDQQLRLLQEAFQSNPYPKVII